MADRRKPDQQFPKRPKHRVQFTFVAVWSGARSVQDQTPPIVHTPREIRSQRVDLIIRVEWKVGWHRRETKQWTQPFTSCLRAVRRCILQFRATLVFAPAKNSENKFKRCTALPSTGYLAPLPYANPVKFIVVSRSGTPLKLNVPKPAHSPRWDTIYRYNVIKGTRYNGVVKKMVDRNRHGEMTAIKTGWGEHVSHARFDKIERTKWGSRSKDRNWLAAGKSAFTAFRSHFR